MRQIPARCFHVSCGKARTPPSFARNRRRACNFSRCRRSTFAGGRCIQFTLRRIALAICDAAWRHDHLERFMERRSSEAVSSNTPGTILVKRTREIDVRPGFQGKGTRMRVYRRHWPRSLLESLRKTCEDESRREYEKVLLSIRSRFRRADVNRAFRRTFRIRIRQKS